MDKQQTIAGLSCGDVLDRLSDYIDGELSAVDKVNMEAHLRQCNLCRSFGISVQQVLNQLKDQFQGDKEETQDAIDNLTEKILKSDKES